MKEEKDMTTNTKLKPFDRTNPDDRSRQLAMVARFGESLCARHAEISAESEATYFEILECLDTYCAELKRMLDGKPLEADRVEQVKQSYLTSLMLIRDMLQSDPKLLEYNPITPPANLSETILNFLTLGSFLFGQNLSTPPAAFVAEDAINTGASANPPITSET